MNHLEQFGGGIGFLQETEIFLNDRVPARTFVGIATAQEHRETGFLLQELLHNRNAILVGQNDIAEDKIKAAVLLREKGTTFARCGGDVTQLN